MAALPVEKDGSLARGDSREEVVEAPWEANMPPVKLARVFDREPLGAGEGEGFAAPGVAAVWPGGTDPGPRPAPIPAVPAALMLLLDPQYSATGALRASLAASSAS